MQFDQDFIEQVRSSVSIIDLVSNYVGLKKSGTNHSGLCPFHHETKPSFLVSESKQIFKCFGCGAGGDAFKFLEMMEGLNFPEAVQHLAERAGIPLPHRRTSKRASEDRKRLLEVMATAQSHFRRSLQEPKGKAARDYLEERQISAETIDCFGMGFAPSGNHLLKTFQSQGLEKEAHLCGLLKESGDGRLYDQFRSRVMFPIRNLAGQPIAFGGRILGEGMPKYLNSPETPLYNKSSNLFAMDVTRDEIRRRGFAILVEGYFDCVVPYQFGFRNVVASLGTSLTEKQVQLLGRYARNAVVSFDPDSAGMAAAVRSIGVFLNHSFRVNIIQLPDGHDPDTFLLEHGSEAYSQVLQNAKPCIDFILEHLMASQRDPLSPKGKQETVAQIAPFLLQIQDPIERSEYCSRVAGRLALQPELVMAEMRRSRKPRRAAPQASQENAIDLLHRATRAETTLLTALLGDRLQADALLSDLEPEIFEGLATQTVFETICHLRDGDREINVPALRDALPEGPAQALVESLSFREPDRPASEEVIRESIRALRRKRNERLIQSLQNEIEQEEAKDSQSARIDELLLKKEEIRRRIELDLV